MTAGYIRHKNYLLLQLSPLGEPKGLKPPAMSTPIINIPQSAILGMHKIQDRPMVIDGKVEVRPMMYLALSYDHRIIDGRESVSFLVRVKELLENPELLLMGKDPMKTLLEV